MALAASWTLGNLTELESHPSVTKTLRGVGGVAAAASSQVPSWKTILAITCVLLSTPLWLPVVLFLTLWIKIASPGQVVFQQERVGYCGKRFMILKLRTMKLNVETQTHNGIANIKLSVPTKHGSQCTWKLPNRRASNLLF
jgi:lipopolysaccharide/colanic/teichoic acid biosynthesis glycosyltransferase